jgi:hypothetical protein
MIPTSATAARALLETAALIGGLQSGRCDQTIKHQCHLALLESCGLYAAARVSEPKVLQLRRVFSAVRSEPPALALEELADHDAQIPLRYLRAQTETAAGNVGGGRKDGSLLQARKDIQRDIIVVNGVRYTGAAEGYEGIVSRIQQALALLEATCFGDSEPLTAAIAGDARARQRNRSAALAAHLLRVCNRTISGGDAYEAAAHVLSSAATAPHFVAALATDAGMGAAALTATTKRWSHAAADGCGLTLVPDSAGATPLELHMDVGPFQFAPHEVRAAPIVGEAAVVDDAEPSGPDDRRTLTAAGGVSKGADDSKAASAAVPTGPPFFIGLRCLVRGATAYWVLREDADFATIVPLLKSGSAGHGAPSPPPSPDHEHSDSEDANDADRRRRHGTDSHQLTAATSRHQRRTTDSDVDGDDDGDEDAVEADGWTSLQPASHRRGKRASAAGSAAAAALGGEGRPRGWARCGYFGRLEATYVRRLAALPSCVLDRPSPGAEQIESSAVGGSSASHPAPEPDTPLMQAILRLAEDEVRRGKPPTALEVAAALQAAVAAAGSSLDAPAEPSAAAAGSATTAAGTAVSATARAAAAETDAADLPPFAGRLFDVGLEGHVVLRFSPADRP